MRILHTSDWHAGKTLYKQDRLPDLQHALQQMLDLIEQQKIDLLVVAGDLYDSFHPPARAMAVLNQFFLDLHRRQVPALIIAGNHDSAHLWQSMREILALASVRVFDRIQRQAHWVTQVGDQSLCLTALPYPSERQLVRLATTFEAGAENLAQQRQRYADKVAALLDMLSRERPQADHHLLCAHLMLSGAEPTHSERSLSLADTFAVQPQHLPEHFDYIALGHIHKCQQVKGAAAPAWYSGTPYQIDFSEQGMDKSVQIIDFAAGKRPQISQHPLELSHPLQLIQCHEDLIAENRSSWAEMPGYLKLRIQVDAPRKGLADSLRDALGPRLLQVEIILPRQQEQRPRWQDLRLDDPLSVYRAYCEAQNLPLNRDLQQTFEQLWERSQNQRQSD